MLPFFASGSVSFAFFLQFFSSWGRCLEYIFGCELLFLGVDVGLVFFGSVLHMFWFDIFRAARPKTVRINSLNVRFPVLGSFSLP